MVSDAVNAVLDAEKQNEEKIALAKAQATGIIEKANKEADSILHEASENARALAQQTVSRAKEKAEALSASIESETGSPTAADKDKYSAAVRAVVSQVLN